MSIPAQSAALAIPRRGYAMVLDASYFPDSLRSAFRRWSRPDVRFNDTGFRCARNDPEYHPYE